MGKAAIRRIQILRMAVVKTVMLHQLAYMMLNILQRAVRRMLFVHGNSMPVER